MRLDINYWKKSVKKKNKHMEAKQHTTNNKENTEEIKEKTKNTYKQMTMKTRQPKTYGMRQRQF